MRRMLPISLLMLLPLAARAEDPARATSIERRLHPHPVEASSFLWNDWNRFQENYHPLYAADDDPRTAWTEGAPSTGAGSWIRFHVTEMQGATRVRLRIRAGYQKSKRLFRANARPHALTVKLLPGGQEAKATLEDRGGWQELVVRQPAGPLDAVELRVDSVYEGTRYEDLCISDVQIHVTATTRDNPAHEKARFQKIKRWKAARLRAARLFKEKAGKEVPLLPAYRLATITDEHGDAGAECQADEPLCALAQIAARAQADPVLGTRFATALTTLRALARKPAMLHPARVAPVDKRPIPSVDGLYVPEPWMMFEVGPGYEGMEMPLLGTLGALRASQLGTFEARRELSLAQVLRAATPAGCRVDEDRIHAWRLLEKTAAGKDTLRALLLARCARIEVRDGVVHEMQLQALVYGGDGHLALVAGPGYLSGFTWATEDGTPVISEGRAVYDDGRVNQLTRPAVAQTP